MALEVLSFVKAAWLKPLWKQLAQLTGERKQELDRLRDEFVDPETLRGLYIEPFLQDRNPADVQQDDLLSAARQPAFERINEFFQGGLPLEKDGRHQMFILSDAGMGKTSLLLMIKLMHLTSFWPQGHSCALFKLGENTLERVQALPNKGETVLLLDALDEDPQAWKRIRDRLLELLKASEDFRRVLISSRTQFFPEMEPDRFGRPEIRVLSGYHCPVLYLSPFTDAQVQDFIERKLPLRWHDYLLLRSGTIRKERAKADCLLKHMQDLRMRPMLLQHIDKLLAKDCRQDWNAYTVYEALLEEWLDREVRKLLEQHQGKQVPERKELFLACLRIAERMQRQETRVISEKELEQLISADANIAWLEQFELGGRSLLNRNSDRAFRFSHYTVQEFLLAWGIVHKQLAEQAPLRATDQLVRFVVLADSFHPLNGQLDCTAFNWQGYASLYGMPSFRDKLSKGDAGPEIVFLPSGYAIGRYPATFAEYDVFCEATGKEKPKDEGWGRAQRPVINVSWEDAAAYCQWLSQETGLPYCLPIQEAWEYACRAGSKSAWCFGDDKAQLGEYAWHKKNSGNKTHPVGEKKANAWGLHDMHGNVWEWCEDWYDAGDYAVSPKENPQGREKGPYCIIRGGSWSSNPLRSVYASTRAEKSPAYCERNLGFRVALSLQPAQR